MFYHEIPILIQFLTKIRNSGYYVDEFIGTFALVLAILLLVKNNSSK